MSQRSTLRAQAVEASGGGCEWPQCDQAGAELAHLHSIGMGGRESADTLDNVAWLCPDHARISDGLYGTGGHDQYAKAHRDLWAAAGDQDAGLRYGWARAEALRKATAANRPGIV